MGIKNNRIWTLEAIFSESALLMDWVTIVCVLTEIPRRKEESKALYWNKASAVPWLEIVGLGRLWPRQVETRNWMEVSDERCLAGLILNLLWEQKLGLKRLLFGFGFDFVLETKTHESQVDLTHCVYKHMSQGSYYVVLKIEPRSSWALPGHSAKWTYLHLQGWKWRRPSVIN